MRIALKRKSFLVAAAGLWTAGCLLALVLWRLWPSPPDVIIILLDALRRDHVGCYGYHRNTTPFIDSVAGEGVVFDCAISQAPSTKASIASLFSSLYPTMHTALWHTTEGAIGDVLPGSVRTLAEAFRDRGYATIGVSANTHIGREFGFTQGFDSFTHTTLLPPPAMNAEALRLLSRAGEKPFFLYLHYMSIHYPYDPPPPYDTLYTARTGPYYYIDWKPEQELSPEDVQYIVDRYDGGINYTDACLKNLFDELERRGKLRNAVVVILADHGEEFMDFGRLGHPGRLYDLMIHVPMIIRMPGGEAVPKRASRVAALIDLYPTLCAFAGIEYDSELLCGVNLLPLIRKGTSVRQAAFSEYYIYQKSIRDETCKYVFPAHPGFTESLHDLVLDPQETVDILAERPDLADRYRRMAARWMEEMKAKNSRLGIIPQQVEIDAKTRAGLKSLGYIQ